MLSGMVSVPLGLQPQPASAHDAKKLYGQLTYVDSRQCIFSQAEQNHGAPAHPVARMVRTYSLGHINGRCNAPLAQIKDRIAHRGWMYAAPWNGGPAGPPCIQGGWQYNQGYASSLEWKTHESLWWSCNNGFRLDQGAWVPNPVVITHDVETGVYNPWDNGWILRQSIPLPTTWHDYCCGPDF
jgi:hypothetical protein